MGAAILALALQAQAATGDFSFQEIEWTALPSRRELGSAYPWRALRKRLSGRVVLKCGAGARGQLLECSVVEEAPVGEGFGAAALSIADEFRIKGTRDGHAVAQGAAILIPVQFRYVSIMLETIHATHPKLNNGKVVLDCRVTNEGRLDNCVAMQERPSGAGLADVAVKLSARMTFGEKADGLERVMLPIEFHGADTPHPPPPRALLASEVYWRRWPTQGEFDRVYPAGSKLLGEVVMRCTAVAGGALDACTIEAEDPAGEGFGDAALSLAGRFKLEPRSAVGNRPIVGEFVRLSLRFVPPRR